MLNWRGFLNLQEAHLSGPIPGVQSVELARVFEFASEFLNLPGAHLSEPIPGVQSVELERVFDFATGEPI